MEDVKKTPGEEVFDSTVPERIDATLSVIEEEKRRAWLKHLKQPLISKGLNISEFVINTAYIGHKGGYLN